MITIERPTVEVHNHFKLQLFDKDGMLKQEAAAYNVANSARYEAVNLGGDWPGYEYSSRTGNASNDRRAAADLRYLLVGKGTGTPSANDTGLFDNLGWNMELSFTRQGAVPTSYDEQIHFSAKATYPDSAKYTGTITEVGLGRYSYVCTHALITNVEGHAITITKAATDILIVTVDIFFKVLLPSSPSFGMKFFPIWATSFINALPAIPGRQIGLSNRYAPIVDGNLCRSHIRYDLPQTTFVQLQCTTNDAKDSVDENNCQIFPITLSSLNNVWYSADKNFGFAHSIVIKDYGVIPLPNAAICPNYNYNNIPIGTGDGTTKLFYTPVNEVVSQKIYVNGVEQTSGVTFVTFDVTKSPCWEKCIGAIYDPYTYETDEPFRPINTPGGAYAHVAMSTAVIPVPVEKGHNTTTAWYGPSARNYSQSNLNGVYPIYYDATGITCDHIRLGPGDYAYGITVKCTNDDIFDSSITPTWTTLVNQSTGDKTIYFTRTTAKYWQLEGFINKSHHVAKSSIEQNWSDSVGIDSCAVVLGDSTVYDYGKVGVNFAVAPADGALITMDAILNLPYKSPDTNITFSYASTVTDPMS